MASEDAEYRIARYERERETCKFHGGPIEECGDDQRDWYPQRVICWPSAQLEATKRRYQMLHEKKPYHDGTFKRWVEDASLDYPFHAFDGVSFWLSPVDIPDDDDWLGQAQGLLAPGENDESGNQ